MLRLFIKLILYVEEYPLLSKMAKIYSGITPGSVPVRVESLLSCAGFLLDTRTTRQTMLMPLHFNDF